MLKFNEQQQIDDIQGALELRPQVEKIVAGPSWRVCRCCF